MKYFLFIMYLPSCLLS